jgi:hypothetical protein
VVALLGPALPGVGGELNTQAAIWWKRLSTSALIGSVSAGRNRDIAVRSNVRSQCSLLLESKSYPDSCRKSMSCSLRESYGLMSGMVCMVLGHLQMRLAALLCRVVNTVVFAVTFTASDCLHAPIFVR